MGARKKVKTKETGEPSAATKPRKQRKSRRSAVEEETTVLMDETVWKELPEELLESVITRVPIATIIRFRLVCHKWNSLPFLQRCTPQELPLIYAVVSDDTIGGSGALYDPLVKKWHYNSHTPPCYHWDGPRCDSGGGLVCYANFRHASFHVSNHLTRTWKVFRFPSLGEGFFAMAFVYNPSVAGGYKIVWVDWEGKYGVLDYSSEKTIITQGRIPANVELNSPMGRIGLAIGNVVYFRCDKPDGIMSYDVMSGTWEQLLIMYPPNSHIVSLAEGGGRLLLVAWADCNMNNNAADAAGIRPCVCVWELDTQMHCWIEVDRMPTSYCPVFKNHDNVNAMCLSTRRLLVISLSGWLLKRRTRRAQEILVQEIFAYDVVSREWSKVPDCILPWDSQAYEVWCGINFFPCLSASPWTP